MKLKKLELIGFKSFADKTSFDFENTLTGLVGPNGSGKSNVVDALKWVLGEQSARSLRGNEMSDMIFNGSNSRRALGSAEVRVTLDNSKGILPVEYEEVCISRRCFRSGESQYALNGSACRLKDIRNLLLDTGFGVSAYSIIEQGQVDMLLQAGSKERRAVLEEAAGINRYLEQKKEAERKLERVRGNLQRIADVIEELERQLRSVRRQASKARRYKNHKDRYIRVRLALAMLENARLLKLKRALENDLKTALEDEKLLEQKIKGLRKEKELKQAELDNSRRQLAAVEERISRLEAHIYSLGKERELNQTRKNELHERIEQIDKRLRRQKEYGSKLYTELETAGNEVSESNKSLENLKHSICRLESELKHAEKENLDSLNLAESEKKNIFELMQRESQVRNQIHILESEIKTIGNRLSRGREREAALKANFGSLQTQSRLSQDKLLHARSSLQDLGRELENLEDRIAGARCSHGELTAGIGDVKAELQGKMERRQVLEDLQARADGAGSGVKLLLNEIENASGPLSGCPGMLGNLIEVSSTYAKAAESALGPYVHAVVVKSRMQAKYALDMLKKNGKGRAYVIAQENLPQKNISANPKSGPDAPCEELIVKISCCGDIKDVLNALVGNCYVSDDPADGAGLPVSAPHGTQNTRMVTKSGELFDSNGVWAAGEPESGGMISRKSELVELQAEIESIRKRLGGLSEEAAEEAQLIEKLQADRRTLLGLKEELLAEEHETASGLSVIESRKNQAEEEIRGIEDELNALQAEQEDAVTDIKSKRKEAQRLAEAKKAREKCLNEVRTAMERAREGCSALKERHGAMEKQFSRIEERQTAGKALITRLQDQLAQNDEEIERMDAELESGRAELERTGEAIAKGEKTTKQLKTELDSLKAETSAGRVEIDSLAERLNAAGLNAESLEEKLKTAEKKRQKTEMGLQENRMKLESLGQRTEEECGIYLHALQMPVEQWRSTPLYVGSEIEEFRAAATAEAPSDKVARWYAEENSQELQQDDDDSDSRPVAVKLKEAVMLQKDVFAVVQSPATEWDALKQEASELKTKIERMGGANLEAIREQDELEVRAQFLTNQREDLETARRHELEIIRELSKKSRARFAATFETVRENFQILIRKLFGGGSGDISLEADAEDILEAGIEISVRPPGKETRSISLLSGGEKALSAVALLFAIFESKPTPFCLLDEVDAPLDEANIGRFLGLLEEYTADTQFVIVTHNKLTMSAAETLYGISMQQDGTSKRVAINFEEVGSRLKEMERETARAKAG